MICDDGARTNIVKRPGMVHFVETSDPQYAMPHPSTFSRSIIPKLEVAVTTFPHTNTLDSRYIVPAIKENLFSWSQIIFFYCFLYGNKEYRL